MSGDADLRRCLDTASELKVVSEYRDKLAALQAKHSHTISILSDGRGWINRFNCFAYALGIWQHDTYIRAVDATSNSAVVNSEFVQRMITDGSLVEVAQKRAREGDVIVYFHEDRVTHAAMIADPAQPMKLRSKWGGNEVHEHGLWEVPASYGDRVRIFRHSDVSATLNRIEALGEARDE
jgi:hypothetical protein